MHSPQDEYAVRVAQRRDEFKRHDRTDLLIATLRGLTALTAFIFLIISSLRWWAIIPAGVFLILIVIHERVIQKKTRASKAVEYYERSIARLNDDWIGRGNAGKKFQDETHLYTNDLDIFGSGSLYELLCQAQTQVGEETLASWLKNPASVPIIRERQQAVQELRTKLDFREDLALAGSEVRPDLHPEVLASWAEKSAYTPSLSLRIVIPVLAFAATIALISWGLYGFSGFPFLLFVIAEMVIIRRLRKTIEAITEGAEQAAPELRVLSRVLQRIENQSFTSESLKSLRAELDTNGLPPSREIAKLSRLLELLDSDRNQFFAPIAIVLLWRMQFSFAIEAWRVRHGPQIRRWMRAVGEMEALSSFACFSFEHPADPFPQIAEDGPRFEATGLGHPLISEKRCVRNDISMDPQTRLFIVSGSNMSGKSTLLRSIGANAILAFAGSTVRANSLRLSIASIGASIRIVDSLLEGTSRFYAEIKRLRHLMDVAKQTTLLFLLDEILHGTNSVDRAAGAEGVLRGFLHYGALGLITTHDLALTQIAEKLKPAAANVHFEDHIENGQVMFDYKLRPDVVQKSNAIALMRSIGLDV
ncbi:MAG: DNA mismatch repair protein MutS [Acidobacteria bacterium]|nr:MAG: DNA mismatch repair protein MutS [Acidobacteriota bacterium]